MMVRILPIAAFALLAACDPSMMPPVPGAEPPEPEVLTLPPEVAAVMPPGAPPTSVFVDDSTGCYLFSIEATDPPSGYYVRDANGNRICTGDAPPEVVG
ncbi:hypothetical protein JQU41_18345 [Ponticoccus sp. SC6-36]|nr:hypothetical protein [Ponticoccus sp. SC6-36]